MTDIRKDHSIGSAGGAVAGAVAGAAAGVAAGTAVGAAVGLVGGPLGMAAGAVVGGILGASAGDSLAEAVNPTDYAEHFRSVYQTMPYYSTGREWSDYEPAYQMGYRAFDGNRDRSYDEIEAELQRNWAATRGSSRLDWIDAKAAVRDGWHYVDRGKIGNA